MLFSKFIAHILLATAVSSAALPVAYSDDTELVERKDAKEVFSEIGNFFKTGDIHDDGKHNHKEKRKNAKEVFSEIGNFFKTGDIHDDGKHHDKREDVWGEIGNFFKTGDIHDDGKKHDEGKKNDDN